MAQLRPYAVDHRGEKRMILATSASNAVQHILRQERMKIVVERAASAIQVAEWVKAGKALETAGEDPPVDDGVERAKQLLGGSNDGRDGSDA